jgi:hypothetical protein
MKEGTCVKAETAGGVRGWDAGDAGRWVAAEVGACRKVDTVGGSG